MSDTFMSVVLAVRTCAAARTTLLTRATVAPALCLVVVLTNVGERSLAQAPSQQSAALREPRGSSDSDDAVVHVLPVQGNVYMLVGAGHNVTLQVEPPVRPSRVPGSYLGAYGALLVDTNVESLGDKILAAVRGITGSPIRYIINTHIHPDHIGGNAILAGSASGSEDETLILSHENGLLQLARADPRPPPGVMPTDSYLDVKEMWLNGESIQVMHQPNAHTDGDSIVYFRKSDVISAGDIFVTTTYPVIDVARGGSIEGVINGLNRILDIAIPESNQEGGTRIIPGHGRLADEADVVEYRNMVVMIRDRIKAMVTKGMRLEEVKAARPTLDYDFRYGTDPSWTTEMFVEAVYEDLSRTVGSVKPPSAWFRQSPEGVNTKDLQENGL